MTNEARRSILVGQIKEESKSWDIIGMITWWSVRNVDISQKDFAKLLKECGLPEKYAREHNYRSAFTRALHNMEEKRIIRLVEEDDTRIIMQFTLENKVTSGGDPKLEYDPETILEVDKTIYRKSGSFEDALTKGRPDIRTKVIEFFYQEKVRYNSNDITRYVQNILGEKGDIISLRDQGCNYFVPAGYQDVLEKVALLVSRLGASTMDWFPIPDTKVSKARVSKAFLDEMKKILEGMQKKTDEVETGNKEVTDKWVQNKLAEVEELRLRLERYAEILPPGEVAKLEEGFTSLEQKLNPQRKLDLGDVVEPKEEAPKAAPKEAVV